MAPAQEHVSFYPQLNLLENTELDSSAFEMVKINLTIAMGRNNMVVNANGSWYTM